VEVGGDFRSNVVPTAAESSESVVRGLGGRFPPFFLDDTCREDNLD
jgi:hypothetical protein